jgi:glutathione S-transferase
MWGTRAALLAHRLWRRAQSTENLALLHINDGVFKQHLDRYRDPQRYPGDVPSREAERSQAVAVLLVPLQARLQGKPYLGGAVTCATDLAIFPFVRQFAAVEPQWFADQKLPAVQAWLAGWLDSPLFAACMVKLPTPHCRRCSSSTVG